MDAVSDDSVAGRSKAKGFDKPRFVYRRGAEDTEKTFLKNMILR
jgi:hypothetical protein